MGKLSIKYFGMLTVKLNLSEEEIIFSCDSITVAELIGLLKKKHGQVIEDYIKKGYQIFVERGGSSQSILNLDKYDTILRNGDKIQFLYTFAGG